MTRTTPSATGIEKRLDMKRKIELWLFKQQDAQLNRDLRDRYETLSDAWPRRCWQPYGLSEPGALVKVNSRLRLALSPIAAKYPAAGL